MLKFPNGSSIAIGEVLPDEQYFADSADSEIPKDITQDDEEELTDEDLPDDDDDLDDDDDSDDPDDSSDDDPIAEDEPANQDE